MTILVTGANGFLGRALVGALASNDASVRGAVRSAGAAAGLPCEGAPVGVVDGQTDWAGALDGVTRVVHLVARTHATGERDGGSLRDYRPVNVDGTRRLAEQAAAAGVERLVFVSSVKVNGERTDDDEHPFRADDAPNPQDAYGISKWEAEQALHEVAGKTALETVIVRPPLAYGPGVKANFARLMSWVRRGVPLPLGAVSNQRSMVALPNLVDLLVTCVHSPKAAGKTFMVSDGHDVSTPELIRGIATAFGTRARLVPVPVSMLRAAGWALGRQAEVDRLCGSLQVDISDTCRTLGWQPVVSMPEALKETVDSFLRDT